MDPAGATRLGIALTCMPARARFLAATAALAWRATPVRAQTFPTLRVGFVPGQEAAMEAWLAVELGYFARAGLNVDVQTFNSGVAAAIIGGSLDVALTTTLTVAAAAARGVPFAIVAAGPVNTAKSPLVLTVVPKNSALHTVRELTGKTVGFNTLRTLAELAFDAWLAQNGVEAAA